MELARYAENVGDTQHLPIEKVLNPFLERVDFRGVVANVLDSWKASSNSSHTITFTFGKGMGIFIASANS